MTQSKAPPPIKPVKNSPHVKWGDLSDRLKRAVETPPPGMTEVKLQFQDEFSPSYAEAYTTDPEGMNNPAARHIFYNQQLKAFLDTALSKAVTLGFARLDFGFPLIFPKVSKDDLAQMFRLANGISQFVPESSPAWLCVQCYIRHAILCNALTEPSDNCINPLPGEAADSLAFRQRGADAMMAVDAAFHLGAAVRELELALLNKTDALRGKKVAKSARNGGEARRDALGPDTEARIASMERLVAEGHTIANAARLTTTKVGGDFSANRKLWTRHKRK